MKTRRWRFIRGSGQATDKNPQMEVFRNDSCDIQKLETLLDIPVG